MIDPRAAPGDDNSIVTLLTRAVADAQSVARAEIDLQKARLVARVDEAKNAVVLLVGAVVAGSLALTGLVVGALMILTPLVGPVWATVIVVGVLLVAAGLLGWLAVRQFKLMLAPAAALPEARP